MINKTPDNQNFNQTLDEKKQELLMQKELQEQEIFDKIAGIKSETIEKLKIIASIGSVAVGAYLVLKYFFGKDITLAQLMPENKENTEKNNLSSPQDNSQENSILNIFKQEIALFLVSIAKQKIVELLAYLQKENTEDADFEEDNQTEN